MLQERREPVAKQKQMVNCRAWTEIKNVSMPPKHCDDTNESYKKFNALIPNI